ncbi:MAG TPA: hypothetical protein ENJ04_08380 [Nitrospirae bacterium]|nr:hypothetical protein [Nitrospirota bacterium]
MRKILFAVGEREFDATQGRLLLFAESLSSAGFRVDILTYSEKVFSSAEEVFKDNDMVRVEIMSPERIPLSYGFRDELLKIYIRQTHHLYIPGTDVRLYKLTAFDDFWGHIESHSFTKMDVSGYDLVLMPLPSDEEPPGPDGTIFCSTVCFLARESGTPIVGIQVFPVVHISPIILRAVDYIVVNEETEKEYLERSGVDGDRIFLLTNPREDYFMSTVEDTYRNFILKQEIPIARGEICIMVFNHPKYRPFVTEALEVISELDVPKVVVFMKRGYNVRELSEDEIITEFYGDILRRMRGNKYLVDPGARAKVIMHSDVVISFSYFAPSKFAAKSGKLSVVYNPLHDDFVSDDGVKFLSDKQSLRNVLSSSYEAKAAEVSITDIVKGVCKR